MEIGHRDLDVHEAMRGSFDYLHLFTTTVAALDRELPRMKRHLRSSGSLWVSWPKGRAQGGDLALPLVIEIGYRHGLVESTTIRVNEVWSAIKFTHPKQGKEYHNSFGELPPPASSRTTAPTSDKTA